MPQTAIIKPDFSQTLVGSTDVIVYAFNQANEEVIEPSASNPQPPPSNLPPPPVTVTKSITTSAFSFPTVVTQSLLGTLIPTITRLGVINANIEIDSIYKEGLPDIIQSFVSTIVGSQDSVNYKEGELIIEMQNSPEDISLMLDLNGHLILAVNTGDADNYSINPQTGHLIYTS